MAAASSAPTSRRFGVIVVAAAAALVLFSMLAKSGIWDPYELDASDLGRRIAVNRFGASQLALEGANNTLPTLTDLKMGELPFTSMALAFRLLGLHDWTGRLPMALWGAAAVVVLYLFLARLVDRRAGVYGTIALLTMPLFFMQARTMLGEIVIIAATTMAFCGLVGAMYDDRDRAGAAPGLGARLAWALIAALGLISGYLSRGLLIGVAIPTLGVGLAWLVSRTAGDAPAVRARDGFGAMVLAVGVVALVLGLRLLVRTSPDAPLRRALGFALLRKPPIEGSFDLTIRQLGHALFPWSAFLPFAVGRLFRAPPTIADEGRARETIVRAALLCGSAVAFAVFAVLGPYAGALAFSAPALLAAIAGVVILDFEREALPSPMLALGCILLGFVLYRDMVVLPEKALVAFNVDRAAFPKSFEHPSERGMLLVYGLFAGLSALTWFEAPTGKGPRGPGAWVKQVLADGRDLFDEVAGVWNGNVLFAAIVVEAAFIGLGAMIFIGKRVEWAPVARLPLAAKALGGVLWWLAPPTIPAVLLALRAARDGFRWLVRRSGLPRAAFTTIAAAAAGGVLSFWYYPALAAQLSPKEAFEAYAHLHGPGEPLGLLGVRSRAAVYYGGEVESFTEPSRAFAWLSERMDARRWMLVKAEELPKLNSMYRQQAHRNLPILDARSSQILLASNLLGDATNHNTLARLVLDDPPKPVNALDAAFEDQLETIGWEIADGDGRLVDSVVPARTYHLRMYYRVLRPVSGNWKAFVHIDGYQRRYNGDHNVLEGRYPINLWQAGDVLLDDCEFQLEPNFTPGGYTIYFGFFVGETRFRVTRGPQQDNRVIAGTLHVR